MAEIVRLSNTHEMVMNWLVLNPEKSLRECADHFGYTQAWLSQLIHSDLFQQALRGKHEMIAVRIAESIPAKLGRLADIGLERLTEQLEKSEDPDFILDATDKILHRMGYAPSSARNPGGSPAQLGNSGVQQNFFINAGDLTAARELMQAAASQPALAGSPAHASPSGNTYDAE